MADHFVAPTPATPDSEHPHRAEHNTGANGA
jgi:hypothetical protein